MQVDREEVMTARADRDGALEPVPGVRFSVQVTDELLPAFFDAIGSHRGGLTLVTGKLLGRKCHRFRFESPRAEAEVISQSLKSKGWTLGLLKLANSAPAPKDDGRPLKRTFFLHPGQAKNVDLAISIAQRAKFRGRPVRANHALDLICLDFNGSRSEDPLIKIERILEGLKRVFDVEVIACRLKDECYEIIHGCPLARKLVEHGIKD